MLDLIIPVYNNKKGLYSTLMSIGCGYHEKIRVTIVDDCSEESYDDVIELFQKIFPIRLFKLPENQGPGIARQFGLDRAQEPFVMFVDCGDIFSSPLVLGEILDKLTESPNFLMYSWAHSAQDRNGKITDIFQPSHNRVHGKVYNNYELLKKYNITFCKESSRVNEDIGFNIACRFISTQIGEEINEQTIYHDENIAIIWTWDDNSIVRKNNCSYTYEKQNIGLAINTVHAINIAHNAGINENIIGEQVYTGMVYSYFSYLEAQINRPEYAEEALKGAALYYKELFKNYSDFFPKNAIELYYIILSEEIQHGQGPLSRKITTIDFPGFLNKLEELTLTMEG